MKSEIVTQLEDIQKLADAIVAVESITDTDDNIDDSAISSFLSKAGTLLTKELNAFENK